MVSIQEEWRKLKDKILLIKINQTQKEGVSPKYQKIDRQSPIDRKQVLKVSSYKYLFRGNLKWKMHYISLV